MMELAWSLAAMPDERRIFGERPQKLDDALAGVEADRFDALIRDRLAIHDAKSQRLRVESDRRLEEARHEVLAPFGRTAHLRERSFDPCAVAALAIATDARDLRALDRRIDLLKRRLDRGGLGFGEAIHADDDVLAALDGLLGAIGRVGDPALHPAAFDDRDAPSQLVD